MSLSVIGTRVEPIGPPLVAPPCPAAESRGCRGVMAPVDSPQTVAIPASGGQVVERLRCSECRESGWYERRTAWAKLAEEFHF